MTPTIGRIVHYKLSEADAAAITRRRTTGAAIADRIKQDRWPLGAQAHIGNPVATGNVVSAIVTAVWPDEDGPGTFGVNAQAFLDGSDSFWVLSAKQGDEPGQWNWPPKV